MPRRPAREVLIALAGPAVNLVLALLLVLPFFAGNRAPDPAGEGAWGFLAYLVLVNLMLALFNLVPAFPMDGGRVLRALMAMRLPYVEATRRAVRVGQVFAVAFFLAVVLSRDLLMLPLIGLFILYSGRRELQGVELEERLRGHRAVDLVDPRPWFLASRDTRVGELCAAMGKEDLAWAVVDLEGLRYGLLSRPQLVGACLSLPPNLELWRVVERWVDALPAGRSLLEVLPRLRRSPAGALPVRDGLHVVGVLSLEAAERAMAGLGSGARGG
jgi:hypothetical protein